MKRKNTAATGITSVFTPCLSSREFAVGTSEHALDENYRGYGIPFGANRPFFEVHA